jgi:hypothetical protein
MSEQPTHTQRKASLSTANLTEQISSASNSETLPTNGSITTSRIFSRPETLPIATNINTTTSSYASHARKVVDEQFQFIASESDDTIDEYELETVEEQRRDVTLERFQVDGDRTIEIDETGLSMRTCTHTHIYLSHRFNSSRIRSS